MSLVSLPPTAADLAVARAAARHASTREETTLRVVTWAADEHLVCAAAAAFWIYGRLLRRDATLARNADRVLACALVSAIVPHGIKRVVDRKRPNRSVVHWPRHGIPKSGKPYDSFPSGHAMHIGALASAVAEIVSPAFRPLVWCGATALAATRILLLAHYPSDVLAGLGLGVLVNKAVDRLSR